MTRLLLRICILLCDDLGPDYAPKGDYAELFHVWLSSSVMTHPFEYVREMVEVTSTTYRVWEGHWPSLEEFGSGGSFDAIILSGGRAASSDPLPWIQYAKQFMRDIVHSPTSQHIKIFGVCLGHQILAEAFGGRVEGAEKVELGVYDLQLTEEGRRWWKGKKGVLRIQQFHRDQVTTLPPHFELLASTIDCPCHSMIKYRDDQRGGHPVGQVITMQGHPELTRDMTEFLMGIRLKSETLTENEIAEAWRRVDGATGTGGADEEIAGWAMLDFMLADKIRDRCGRIAG